MSDLRNVNIVITGQPGVGKTTIAVFLGELLNKFGFAEVFVHDDDGVDSGGYERARIRPFTQLDLNNIRINITSKSTKNNPRRPSLPLRRKKRTIRKKASKR